MILLNALVTDIVFEAVRLVVLAVLIVVAVILGKKLRDRTDAKKAQEEQAAGGES